MAEHEEHHDEKHSSGHGGGGHGGHAAGGHGDGEHEGAPEWLISFADNVTLMMAFFVILLAMNLKQPTTGGIGGDEKNPSAGSDGALDLSIAIRSAFNNPVSATSTNPYEQALVRRLRERSAEGHTGNSNQDGPAGQFDSVQALAPSDYYTPSGIVHFAQGSSELSAVAHDEIARIAEEIRGLSYVIEVRGHANPYEVFNNQREGFRFSFDRAEAVAAALVAAGIPDNNLRVVACSDGVPLPDRARTRHEGEQLQIVEVVTTGEPVQPRPTMPDGRAGSDGY